MVLCTFDLVNELWFVFSHINLYSLHLLILEVHPIHPLQIVHLFLQSFVSLRPSCVAAAQVLGCWLLDEVECVSCGHYNSGAASDDLLLFSEETQLLLLLSRPRSWISVSV